MSNGGSSSYVYSNSKKIPEIELVDLVNLRFGVFIKSSALKEFIVTNWPIVSRLAHEIRDNATNNISVGVKRSIPNLPGLWERIG